MGAYYSLFGKIFEGICTVDFIVLLVERTALWFRGASHDISTEGGAKSILTISGFLSPETIACRTRRLDNGRNAGIYAFPKDREERICVRHGLASPREHATPPPLVSARNCISLLGEATHKNMSQDTSPSFADSMIEARNLRIPAVRVGHRWQRHLYTSIVVRI